MKKYADTVPHVLKRLAHVLGTKVRRRRLDIPVQYGKGYCAGFIFNEHIRMLISNYELHEDIVLENPERNADKRMIFFKFQHIFPSSETWVSARQPLAIPSVLIATSRLNTDNIITIHSNTATINIEVDADYLKGLFHDTDQSPVLQHLLENAQPYLFEQIIYASLQKVINEILYRPADEKFELFLMRIKAEELICRLMMELEKRDETRLYALNIHDIETIYKVREAILERLEIPPVIGTLAAGAGMSPTKLKRLFRQIFGESIFRYYQQFRMQEATFLLKEKKYSVSETGYSLGFTNLSHFSKIFKAHTGMNPKQYAMT